MQGRLLVAALVCAAVTPALALGQSTATFTATDPNAWSANGTPADTLTVTAPATVTFEYPVGRSGHNVAWDGAPPPCDGDIPDANTYGVAGWKGTCTFTRPGTYRFHCQVHVGLMQGTVVVLPAPTPTPDDASPATPPPAVPPPAAQPLPAPPVTITVPAVQRGTTVRGRLAPAGPVEVTVRLAGVRVGHATGNGAAFAVRLNAAARRRLRHRTLRLDVTVAAGGTQRTFVVRLRG